MTETQNHTEIFEAALDTLEEGVAVLDTELRVIFWNRAATAITGYPAPDLLFRVLPPGAYQIDLERQTSLSTDATAISASSACPMPGHMPRPLPRPVLVHLRHRLGHTLPAMLRRSPLRDALGRRFGTLLRFHPVEDLDALPHGVMAEETSLEQYVEQSQAALEDRLEEAWREWTEDGVPFGLLWINVDQAASLRRSHGHDASESMLAILERTLLHALRPTETLGRWGTHEFLVLCHERSPAMLEAHASHVCALARTADFRWWGDRIQLTVSIGATHAEVEERLSGLLQRAQLAMEACQRDGGNTVRIMDFKPQSGGAECSRS